ncbi:MAG: AraC family transcriptional regulator [Burkholderiaceae bacterium]
MLAATRTRHSQAAARLAAALPAPLLSSRSRNWHGVTVELHHFRGVDAMMPMREHLVGIHLSGSVNLRQTRGRRSAVVHVRPGDVTISPFGEPKRFQHAGENVVLLLRIAPAFVQDIAGEEYALDPLRFELREAFGTPDVELVTLGKQLLAGLELEGLPSRLQIESLAAQLALHLLRHHCTRAVSERRAASNLSPRKLQRVLDYIESSLRDDVALADLARLVAMSPGHFAHLFRHTTGLPPHRFVLERRIERAKSLLRDTELPITEIAQQVGCASHSHLSVMFHRDTGITPSDYRRQR